MMNPMFRFAQLVLAKSCRLKAKKAHTRDTGVRHFLSPGYLTARNTARCAR